jgi:hypothetical protein
MEPLDKFSEFVIFRIGNNVTIPFRYYGIF